MSRTEELRGLAGDVRRALGGHDLALYSAGVTAYAAIAFVPVVLLALRGCALVLGADTTARVEGVLLDLLPEHLRAEQLLGDVVDAGVGLDLVGVLACLFPATFYGEGLLRAFDRLAGDAAGDLPRSWRGRLLTLPAIGALPAALFGVALAGRSVYGGDDQSGWSLVLGIYVAFLVGWVTLSTLLVFAYWLLARRRPGWRSLLWGGFATGSFVSGFLLGFALFWSWDLPLGRPFGGFVGAGAAVALLLWGFVFHLLVLVGYVATLELGRRDGRPTGRRLHHGADDAARADGAAAGAGPAPDGGGTSTDAGGDATTGSDLAGGGSRRAPAVTGG